MEIFDPEQALTRSGRYFGGLRLEIINRYPQYLSDITDAFEPECIATILSTLFAVLAAAITFGGLLGEKTGHLMGTSETLVVTCLGGILFGLFSGQPLILIGLTGPLLQLDEYLYNYCKNNNVDFLSIRIWIALSSLLLCMVVLAFELARAIRWFTRFTQEIFSLLVASMFLFASLTKIHTVFVDNPLLSVDEFISLYCKPSVAQPPPTWKAVTPWSNAVNKQITMSNVTQITPSTLSIYDLDPMVTMQNQPNTALMSLILMASTVIAAKLVRYLRATNFLPHMLRNFVANFAVPIGIVAPVVVARCFASKVYTQMLIVPDGLSTSIPTRGWLISPFGQFSPLQIKHIGVGVIGGILVFIVLFLQVELCEVMMSKKERKTRKGTGFHLDLLVICLIELGCAFIGGPWLSAAAVRCVAHVSSLSVMRKDISPAVTPPEVEGVREQRVTGVVVSMLVGLALFMGPLLRQVPVAVIFGVFFYMGCVSLKGNQFVERIFLIFKMRDNHPVYARRVPLSQLYAFTGIQVMCFIVLLGLQLSPYALLMPFAILCLVPIRRALNSLFREWELSALDCLDPVLDPAAELLLTGSVGQTNHMV